MHDENKRMAHDTTIATKPNWPENLKPLEMTLWRGNKFTFYTNGGDIFIRPEAVAQMQAGDACFLLIQQQVEKLGMIRPVQAYMELKKKASRHLDTVKGGLLPSSYGSLACARLADLCKKHQKIMRQRAAYRAPSRKHGFEVMKAATARFRSP
jgi:hypothetical protein